MSTDCNPFPIPHSLFMSIMCVYVFPVLHTVSPASVSVSLTSLLSSSVSQTVSFSRSISPFFCFSLVLRLPVLTHPSFPWHTRLSFSTAVTMVFSSIYRKATRLLKAEPLPWALLFASDFPPLTIFRCN